MQAIVCQRLAWCAATAGGKVARQAVRQRRQCGSGVVSKAELSSSGQAGSVPGVGMAQWVVVTRHSRMVRPTDLPGDRHPATLTKKAGRDVKPGVQCRHDTKA